MTKLYIHIYVHILLILMQNIDMYTFWGGINERQTVTFSDLVWFMEREKVVILKCLYNFSLSSSLSLFLSLS